MKNCLFVYTAAWFLLFILPGKTEAQFVKHLKDAVKSKAEQKAIDKTEQAIDKTADKATQKKKRNNPQTDQPADAGTNQPDAAGNTETEASSSQTDTPQNGTDGFITLNLSATRIFAGGILTISGESGMYENVNTVQISINGPGTHEQKTVPLKDSTFHCIWYANKTGTFTVSATSSDGKSSTEQTVVVYTISGLGSLASDNITITEQAEQQLEEAVNKALPSLSTADGEKLKGKLKEAEEKIDLLKQLYTDINTAGKQLSSSLKKGSGLSDNMSAGLSALNNQLEADGSRMKKTMELGKHEPYDNTICEYLVMINEAAAAFSTFGNIFPGTLVGIVKSIALDKGVPYATDNTINTHLSNPGVTEGTKESAKLFATAAADGEGLVSKMGIAGFVGDMVQIITNVLLKQYCGVMSGTVSETYKVEYRNQSGQNWWTYGYTTKGVITLRYPKEAGNGKVVKMKGNIEGNATHFDFAEDITKQDDFKREAKNRVAVLPLVVKTPLLLGFPTVEADKLGFGAIARALVTPAYFNIPVDAEYDRDAGTIRLYMNEALIDFSAFVENKVLFVTPVPLPLFRVQSFPIEKVKKTMNAVVKRSKGYKVIKAANGSLSFKDDDSFHVGNAASEDEQTVHLILNVKQQ